MSRVPFILPLFALASAGGGPMTSSEVAVVVSRPPVPARIEVGDKLPITVIEGLTQTPAHSFSEFYGRTVVLEFFAFWCGPCANSVPHMNALQAKYGSRGLSVVGVTSENAPKTEPWIAKHGAEYAYGYDLTGELHQRFGITGIPFCALVGPFGTVLWTGHPASLTDAQVEAALKDSLSQPVWEWPAEARALAGPLSRGEYATAMGLARSLAPQPGFDFPLLVQGRIDALVARFEGLTQRREYGPAMSLGQRLETEFAGLPEGQRMAVRLGELRADPVIIREVDALAKIVALEQRVPGVRKLSQARKLREDVVAFLEEYPGSTAEARARTLLQMLERELEQFPQ